MGGVMPPGSSLPCRLEEDTCPLPWEPPCAWHSLVQGLTLSRKGFCLRVFTDPWPGAGEDLQPGSAPG